MSRMFQSLGLLVLSCLFLTATSQTGEISLLQNLTLQWIDDFTPELSWAPPQESAGNCTYKVSVQGITDTLDDITQWSDYTILNGGFLHCSVTANCSNKRNKTAVCNVSYPELVTNLDCYLYAENKYHCGWAPATHAPEPRFFYRLINQGGGSDSQPELRECPSYSYTDGVKTGCELSAHKFHEVIILFNGTQNNTLVRNTFSKLTIRDVRPPPLTWTVTKSGDELNISWINPGILKPSDWEFIINYTECNNATQVTIKKRTSHQIPRIRHCQYRIAIQAQAKDKGITEWSDEKTIDIDPDPLVYIAFIIPLVFTILAALTFICCQRNKEKICPRIIKPVNLISDIDNNNKTNLFSLHVAAEEEETCEITVIDPQAIRLDC